VTCDQYNPPKKKNLKIPSGATKAPTNRKSPAQEKTEEKDDLKKKKEKGQRENLRRKK